MVLGLNGLTKLNILFHKFIHSNIQQSVLHFKRKLIPDFLDLFLCDSGQFYGFGLEIGLELF